MAEHLEISSGEKEEVYATLLKQVVALVGDETDQTANLANVSAALQQTFNHLWVGFYMVKDGELVLGPFSRARLLALGYKKVAVCAENHGRTKEPLLWMTLMLFLVILLVALLQKVKLLFHWLRRAP